MTCVNNPYLCQSHILSWTYVNHRSSTETWTMKKSVGGNECEKLSEGHSQSQVGAPESCYWMAPVLLNPAIFGSVFSPSKIHIGYHIPKWSLCANSVCKCVMCVKETTRYFRLWKEKVRSRALHELSTHCYGIRRSLAQSITGFESQ